MKFYNILFFALLFLVSCSSSVQQKDNNPVDLPHVLVIGIDGLGAHGVGMAQTPIMDEMIKNGAYSLEARTVMPSVSAPAWSSMFTGTTVDRHGVGSNSWRVDNKVLVPVYKGKYDMFPTIFGEIRDNYPEAKIGAVYHWGSIGNLIEKDVCDFSVHCETEDETTQKACELLAENKPNFMFVHLDHVDHAGHHGGYRSEEYAQSVEKADSLIDVFMQTLQKINLLEKTTVFVIADHGGINNGHGGSSPDEMIVPLFIYGKDVKRGYEITHPVFTYDLAPTLAGLFGVSLNEWVNGEDINDAFEN